MAGGHLEELEIDDDNNTNMNTEKSGGCEQESCASQQTTVTICVETPKEFHKRWRFYSSDDGVLTSEGGYSEELAHDLIENFNKKCTWDTH